MCGASALRVFMTFSSGGASAVVEESRRRQGKGSWTSPDPGPAYKKRLSDAFLHYTDAAGNAPRDKRGDLYRIKDFRKSEKLRERFTPAPSGDLTGTKFATAVLNGGSTVDLSRYSDQPGGLLV